MPAVDHDERRKNLVAAAMRLFSGMGYAKVSFLDVSKATGIARTALYRYYRTKRELFDAAIHSITSPLKKELAHIGAENVPVAARLEKSCAIVVDTMYYRKDFFAAIYEFVFSMVRAGHDMTGRIEEFTVGFKVAVNRLLRKGVENGEFRSGIDTEHATEAFYALMESVALRVMLGIEKDPARAKKRFATVIAGLLA